VGQNGANSMLQSVPRLKVFVRKDFLSKEPEDAVFYEKAYLVSIHARPNEPFLFSVHLQSGALFSGLPVHALSLKEIDLKNKDLVEPTKLGYWGALSDEIQTIQISYLKNYLVRYQNHSGFYLFSIEPTLGGYTEDPEQYKLMHVIAFQTGQIGIYPNNDLLFIDEHFVDESLPTGHYRRNSKKRYAW
jgi:hypothetical protein